MYRGTFNNQTFYCRTLHQANNVNSGINEPFNGDLLVTNELLKLFPNKNKCYIDIGSNIGTYAISHAKYFDKVLAYEPEIENYRLLKKNVTDNNIQNIIVNNWAILDREGMFSIKNHNHSPGVHPGTYYIDFNSEGDIPCKKLDNELKKNDVESVDFIKIDTEGSEYFILQSIKDILIEHNPILCIEINYCSNKNYGINENQIKSFLNNLNYKLYKVNGCNYYYIS
jgi:FkbM family methyltransferase